MKVLSNAIGKCVDLNIDSKRRIRWVQILNQDCFHIDLHVLTIVYSEVIFDRLSKTYLYMVFYRFSNNTMVFLNYCLHGLRIKFSHDEIKPFTGLKNF